MVWGQPAIVALLCNVTAKKPVSRIETYFHCAGLEMYLQAWNIMQAKPAAQALQSDENHQNSLECKTHGLCMQHNHANSKLVQARITTHKFAA